MNISEYNSVLARSIQSSGDAPTASSSGDRSEVVSSGGPSCSTASQRSHPQTQENSERSVQEAAPKDDLFNEWNKEAVKLEADRKEGQAGNQVSPARLENPANQTAEEARENQGQKLHVRRNDDVAGAGLGEGSGLYSSRTGRGGIGR